MFFFRCSNILLLFTVLLYIYFIVAAFSLNLNIFFSKKNFVFIRYVYQHLSPRIRRANCMSLGMIVTLRA